MLTRLFDNTYTRRIIAACQTAYQFCTQYCQAIAVKLFMPYHQIIMIGADVPGQQYAKMLRELMDSNEPAARSCHNTISHITGSSFFLSNIDDKAKHLRQLLSLSLRENEAVILHETEETIARIIKYLGNQGGLNHDAEHYIHHEIRSLVIRSLTGLVLTPAMQSALDLLEKMPIDNLGFMPGLPYYLRLFSSSFRQFEKEYQKAITEFLTVELARLQFCQLPEHNLLRLLIRGRYPDVDITTLLQNENIRRELIDDPDFRLSVTGAFATTNLSIAIGTALVQIYRKSNQFAGWPTHRSLIVEELANSHPEALLKDTKSYLHAVWLEALRYRPPLRGVQRITKQGMTLQGMDIPPNSFIHMEFPVCHNTTHDKINESTFEPIRHKSSGYYLHREKFTPFGLGSRMCPAHYISEIIFKKIILGIAEKVEHLTPDCIKLTTDKEITVCQKHVSNGAF